MEIWTVYKSAFVNLVPVTCEVPIIGEHYFQVWDIYCIISAPNLYTYSGRMNL